MTRLQIVWHAATGSLVEIGGGYGIRLSLMSFPSVDYNINNHKGGFTMKRERGIRFRARAALAFLFVVFAGCGGGNQPRLRHRKGIGSRKGAPAGIGAAEGTSVRGGHDNPHHARDAARIVDLRTFPPMEGAEVQSEKLSDVTYTAPGTMQQAAGFCVKHLAAAGGANPPGSGGRIRRAVANTSLSFSPNKDTF